MLHYYADRTFTNLTDACLADTCDLVTAGNSNLVSSVNYSAPVDREDIMGCVASTRTYFDEIPAAQCTGVSKCSSAYCGCLNGQWNAELLEWVMPAAQPADSVADSCLGTAVGCLTLAALDVYVFGAAPLNADPCLAWAVPIAEDYTTLYNTTLRPCVVQFDITSANYCICRLQCP